MVFDALFLGLFVMGWVGAGTLAWLVGSVATRGNAGLGTLPLAAFAGVVGGLLVPFVGFTGRGGLFGSFVVAALFGAMVTFARILGRSRSR